MLPSQLFLIIPKESDEKQSSLVTMLVFNIVFETLLEAEFIFYGEVLIISNSKMCVHCKQSIWFDIIGDILETVMKRFITSTYWLSTAISFIQV